MNIPFNRQNLFGTELEYIQQAYKAGKVAGDGMHTKHCQQFICDRFGVKKSLLTTSGTDALELAFLLIKLQPGDEVIVPSYTFVSTVNAFVLRGAVPVFCELRPDTMNMDEQAIEALITPNTKAIVPVHYAGVACEMDVIMALAAKYNLWVVEDAAQGVNAKYKGKYLGTIGHLGCYSFHETKNYSMGEGGALIINDESLFLRAEILREKGTNRSQFFRGEVDKYGWVDVGSSFLPSDINAAVLHTQFDHLEDIQNKRLEIWNTYYHALLPLQQAGKLRLPIIPEECEHNAHMFYVLMNHVVERDALMNYLKGKGVMAVFHYVPLHNSLFAQEKYISRELPMTIEFSERLLRLPMFYDLSGCESEKICSVIIDFFD
jgi:dTDP-4-amino-4,6-dideoxygalactose transaminase